MAKRARTLRIGEHVTIVPPKGGRSFVAKIVAASPGKSITARDVRGKRHRLPWPKGFVFDRESVAKTLARPVTHRPLSSRQKLDVAVSRRRVKDVETNALVRTLTNIERRYARPLIVLGTKGWEKRLSAFLRRHPAVNRELGELNAGKRSSAPIFARTYAKEMLARGQRPTRGATAPMLTALPGSARGKHYDLAAVQARLGRDYFRNWKPIAIRWDPGKILPSLRGIRLGLYQPPRQQITINRILDQRGVPREALEHTVYHEMLHHGMPSTIDERSGRREMHPPAFRARERMYRGFAKSEAWREGPLRAFMVKNYEARTGRKAPRNNPAVPGPGFRFEIYEDRVPGPGFQFTIEE